MTLWRLLLNPFGEIAAAASDSDYSYIFLRSVVGLPFVLCHNRAQNNGFNGFRFNSANTFVESNDTLCPMGSLTTSEIGRFGCVTFQSKHAISSDLRRKIHGCQHQLTIWPLTKLLSFLCCCRCCSCHRMLFSLHCNFFVITASTARTLTTYNRPYLFLRSLCFRC